MKVLVTGATGFIGRALIEELKRRHLDVIALARKSKRADPIRAMGIPVKFADVTDSQAFSKAIKDTRPGIIIHCAAKVLGATAEEYYKINAQGTENVCRVSSEFGVRRLVHISSVAAISGSEDGMLSDDMPLKAGGPYGESKAEAERIVNAWREKGLRCAIVRPCMVYGKNEPHAMRSLTMKTKYRMIPVLGDSLMKRKIQLGYVGNVVEVIVLCMKKAEALEGAFIAADREVFTYGDLLEILYSEITGGKPPVVPQAAAKFLLKIPLLGRKIDNIFKERTYDISRAQNLLGWNGGRSASEVFREAVAYWKKRI